MRTGRLARKLRFSAVLAALCGLLAIMLPAESAFAFSPGVGPTGTPLADTLAAWADLGLGALTEAALPATLLSLGLSSDQGPYQQTVSQAVVQCRENIVSNGGFPDWLNNPDFGGDGSWRFFSGPGTTNDGWDSACDPLAVFPLLYTAPAIAAEPWLGRFCASVQVYEGGGYWPPTSASSLPGTSWSWLTNTWAQSVYLPGAHGHPVQPFNTAQNVLDWYYTACPAPWLTYVYGTGYTGSIAGVPYTPPGGYTGGCNIDLPATSPYSVPGSGFVNCSGTVVGPLHVSFGMNTDSSHGCSSSYSVAGSFDLTMTGLQGTGATPGLGCTLTGWINVGITDSLGHNIATNTLTHTGTYPTTGPSGSTSYTPVSPAPSPTPPTAPAPSVTIPTSIPSSPPATLPAPTPVTAAPGATTIYNPDDNSILSTLANGFNAVVNGGEWSAGSFAHAISQLSTDIGTDLSWVVTQLSPLLEGIWTAVNGVGTGVAAMASTLDGDLQSIQTLLLGVLNVAVTNWPAAWTTALTTTIPNAIAAVATDVLTIPAYLVTLGTDIVALPAEIGTAVTTGLTTSLETLFEPSTTTVTDVKTEVATTPPFDLAPPIVGGFATIASGISGGLGDNCAPHIGWSSTGGVPAFGVNLPTPSTSGCPGNGPGGSRTTEDNTGGDLYGYRLLVRYGAMAFMFLAFGIRLLRAAPWNSNADDLSPNVEGTG